MPGWIKLSIDETCHVVWKVHAPDRDIYLHAIGDGPAGNRVTEDCAEKRFNDSGCRTPWLPVLFTDRVQVKVYRGQDSDPGLPMRALRALQSVNTVEPVVDADDPISPAPRTVLSGAAPCSG